MEIFGGFMVMVSILGLFLAVVWLIMPFVVFAIKGKLDRSLEILEGIDKRLAVVEQKISAFHPPQATAAPAAVESADTAAYPSDQTPSQPVLPLA